MKISDIVVEGRARKPLRASVKNALPNMSQYDTLDNNNHPYLAYRFGVALAKSPDGDMDQQGPIGSNFNMIDYSEGDAEIRRGAERIMGVKPNRSTGKGSYELDNTNTQSPIKKQKANRFGV